MPVDSLISSLFGHQLPGRKEKASDPILERFLFIFIPLLTTVTFQVCAFCLLYLSLEFNESETISAPKEDNSDQKWSHHLSKAAAIEEDGE